MSWTVPEEDILVSDLASISTHAAENTWRPTHTMGMVGRDQTEVREAQSGR